MAATAVSILPWPEIITTGSSGCSLLDPSSSCSPSSRLPCSQMSRNTRFGRRAAIGGQRLVAVARGARAVAFVLQDAGDQFADIGFVVDDEDVGRHDRYSLLPCECRRLAAASERSTGSAREAQLHPGAARARDLVGGIAQFDAAAVLFENRPTIARPRPVPFSRVVT